MIGSALGAPAEATHAERRGCSLRPETHTSVLFLAPATAGMLPHALIAIVSPTHPPSTRANSSADGVIEMAPISVSLGYNDSMVKEGAQHPG